MATDKDNTTAPDVKAGIAGVAEAAKAAEAMSTKISEIVANTIANADELLKKHSGAAEQILSNIEERLRGTNDIKDINADIIGQLAEQKAITDKITESYKEELGLKWDVLTPAEKEKEVNKGKLKLIQDSVDALKSQLKLEGDLVKLAQHYSKSSYKGKVANQTEALKFQKIGIDLSEKSNKEAKEILKPF